MEASTKTAESVAEPKHLNVFERWLSLWVALCMVAGVALGRLLPGLTDVLRRLEFGWAIGANPRRKRGCRGF